MGNMESMEVLQIKCNCCGANVIALNKVQKAKCPKCSFNFLVGDLNEKEEKILNSSNRLSNFNITKNFNFNKLRKIKETFVNE